MRSRLYSLALAMLITLPTMAAAQERPRGPAEQIPCGPRTDILEALKDAFREVPVGRGLSIDGNMLELLASPNGSWTVLLSRANGSSCFATTGEAWESVAPATPARGDSMVGERKLQLINALRR